MQRPQFTDFPSQDVAQAAYNSNDHPSNDSFPQQPQFGISSFRQSVDRPSHDRELSRYPLVSGPGTNVAGSDTRTPTAHLNLCTSSSGYRPRQDVLGSWSFRRATLVNDEPPDIARTLSDAEEGHADPKATAGVFSSLSKLSRSISNPKGSGLPAELLYPSDPDTTDLFSPMANIVHSKSRGSFSSRTIQDDQENARLRPGLQQQQASYSHKDPTKEEPVITKYIRCMS